MREQPLAARDTGMAGREHRATDRERLAHGLLGGGQLALAFQHLRQIGGPHRHIGMALPRQLALDRERTAQQRLGLLRTSRLGEHDGDGIGGIARLAAGGASRRSQSVERLPGDGLRLGEPALRSQVARDVLQRVQRPRVALAIGGAIDRVRAADQRLAFGGAALIGEKRCQRRIVARGPWTARTVYRAMDRERAAQHALALVELVLEAQYARKVDQHIRQRGALRPKHPLGHRNRLAVRGLRVGMSTLVERPLPSAARSAATSVDSAPNAWRSIESASASIVRAAAKWP